MNKKVIKFCFAGLAALIVFFGVYVLVLLNSKIPVNGDIITYIPPKAGINKTLEILNTQGIFKPAPVYKIICKVYAKISGRHIFAGSFKFNQQTTNAEVLYSIFTGKQLYTIKVTFPEGITINKFAVILSQKIGINANEFVKFVNSDSVRNANDIPIKNSEGYLMPDTYEFYWKQPIPEVANKLLTAQHTLWNKKFAKPAFEQGKSKHEILSLASLIEAESPLTSERPRISGVFCNRLRIGMTLQSDPTVQYAIGGEKKRVLYRHLDINSPYNTYKYSGLPVGPINSPSASSIEAAIYPEENDYLYFVAVGDGSGKHNFSRTANQHGYYVSQYRKNVAKYK